MLKVSSFWHWHWIIHRIKNYFSASLTLGELIHLKNIFARWPGGWVWQNCLQFHFGDGSQLNMYLISKAKKKLEILSIHPDEQNHLLTKKISLSLHPNFHWAPFTFSRLKYLQGHSHFLDSEILALNRTLLLSWYSYHPWATFTFLILKSLQSQRWRWASWHRLCCW